MTRIQPAAPHNATRPPKAHAHKGTPAGDANAAFLALLALLVPPTANPADPQAGPGPTAAPHASQADAHTAQGIHGKDAKKEHADAKRTGALPMPGGGLLLPMPVLIGSLAPTNQPNATPDARAPDERRAPLLAPGVTSSQINGSTAAPDSLAQTQTGAAATHHISGVAPAKIPQQPASVFTASPPPAPDVAPANLPQPVRPASAALRASQSNIQPASMRVPGDVLALATPSNLRKRDQASITPLRAAFEPGHPPALAPPVTAAQPATSAPLPGIATAAQHLVAQAHLLRQGQTTEMRLRLRPSELGEVRVTLRRDGEGKLSVHLIPATAEGEAALRTNLHHLRAALDQQSGGQGADVSLGQRESSNPQQHARHENTHKGDWDDTAPPSAPVSPAAIKVIRTSISSRAGNGAVDYDA